MASVVRVTVEGGVVQHVEVPSGVTVVVRDYDVDSCDEIDLERDANGDRYFEQLWHSEK